MENPSTILALCLGLLMRLGFPSVVTLVIVYFLRELDRHWQAEAEEEIKAHAATIEKPQYWKTKNSVPENRQACPVFISTKPCWQMFRLPNGYLREECLTCEIFRNAPIPKSHVLVQ